MARFETSRKRLAVAWVLSVSPIKERRLFLGNRSARHGPTRRRQSSDYSVRFVGKKAKALYVAC